MTTQSLRGMANHGPMHWRGDRTGGNDPGGDPLDEDARVQEVQRRVRRPARPRRADQRPPTCRPSPTSSCRSPIRRTRSARLDNSLTPDQQAGRDDVFFDGPAVRRRSSPATAATRSTRRSGHFGTDGFSTLRGRDRRSSRSRTCATCTRRSACSACRQVAFFNPGDNGNKGDQVRGFGFLHDGSVDTLFRFHNAAVFNQTNPAGFPSNPAASRPAPPARHSGDRSSSSCSPSTRTWRRSSASR